MVAAFPILIQQSPSENEKNVQLLGAKPPDPTGVLPLDHELNLTKSVCSVMSTTDLQCSVSFSIIGRRLVEKKV